MTTRGWIVPVLGLLVIGLALAPAIAEQPGRDRSIARELGASEEFSPGGIAPQLNFIANATGFQEVPAVLTQGRANLRARLNASGNGIEYRLVYRLDGPVRAAHIRVGQGGANGNIAVVLCSNALTNLGGSSVPPCPGPFSGEVEGTLFEQDLRPQASDQGVDSLETLLAAMMARVAYVNVDSDRFPEGEVRGQIARLRLTGPGSGPGLSDSLEGTDADDW